MSTPAWITLLLAVSFIVAPHLRRFASRWVVLSGAEYLVVGLLIGPHVSSYLLSAEMVDAMQPLVSLLIGVLGFYVGLRARRSQLRGAPLMVGALSATGVLLAMAAVTLLVLDLAGVAPPQGAVWYRWTLYQGQGWRIALEAPDAHVWLSLAIGAAACVASTTAVQSVRAQLRIDGPVGRMLLALAESSQWVGITGLGVALALGRAADSHHRLGIGLAEWAMLALAFGGICGILFSFFIGREQNPQKVFLAALGAVIFASGVGAALGVSPLFVNLTAGLVVAYTSSHAQVVFKEVERAGQPLFVLTMILAGAMWSPVSGVLWLLPLIFIGMRVVTRALFVRLFTQALVDVRARLDAGLLAQGSVAVAVAINCAQRYPSLGGIVLTTVLGAALVNEVLSVRALRAVLVDAGEFSHTPPTSEATP